MRFCLCMAYCRELTEAQREALDLVWRTHAEIDGYADQETPATQQEAA
jgi:hypothetical protein